MSIKRAFVPGALVALLLAALFLAPVCAAADDEVVLRICNWEEYIDLGEWDPEEDVIDLESGDIFGENSMIEDFESWYEETYGIKVRVDYSTFGTNEDLYNMLTIGDVYDLVCPSDYMIMKLMAEDRLVPLSAEFRNPGNENNYYVSGLSPYIRDIFDSHEINGQPWSDYAAGYMWGITGFVYNPEVVSEEDASTWKLLENDGYDPETGERRYYRRITMKDNVRDAYFTAIGALKSGKLTDKAFLNDPDYAEKLQDEMNDVSQQTILDAQDYLQKIKDNLYSFETDSGKADMITGKVVANYQWSGDAVYTMDQADEDDYTLCFAVPRECTNIYFDGWVMLKSGIGEDARKQQAAEAFINFISRPDNVIRNMYYIGYTSAISAGDDGRIFEYLDWNYGAEQEEADDEGEAETDTAGEDPETSEDVNEEPAGTAEGEEPEVDTAAESGESAEEETDTVEYDLSYFFSGEGSKDEYVLTVDAEQLRRQLSAQYPSREVIERASIMIYFDDEQNEMINRMWIRVRCFNINSVPVWAWIVLATVIVGGTAFWLWKRTVRKRQYE